MIVERSWISVSQFAELASVPARTAKYGISQWHKGHEWRGLLAQVQVARGRGGARGAQYRVAVDSLPAELRERAAELGLIRQPAGQVPALAGVRPSLPAVVAAPPPVCLPAFERRDHHRKYALIAPAVNASEGRTTIVREIAATETRLGRPVSERTLWRLIKAHEKDGIAGLVRKAPATKGRRRYLISDEWDRIPGVAALAPEIREAFRARLEIQIGSLWNSEVPSRPNVQRFATSWLMLATAAALDNPDRAREILEIPPKEATKQLRTLVPAERANAVRASCKVPTRLVEEWRVAKIGATKRTNAKEFFDKHLTRVQRSREGLLPMDVVFADVHHIDILLQDPNGRIFTPKAVAWSDAATNSLFATLVFPEERRMVRTEHVVASFIAMTQNSAWGMPHLLYHDNGGEYGWTHFADDAMKLAQDPRGPRRTMIIKARPYNAPAKVIEGLFGALEKVFSMLPGYIGGNRMRAKTHNVGRDPIPFDGDLEAFECAFQIALAHYNITPQSGHLKDRSPREAFNAFVSAGWQRVDIDPLALECAFAKTESYVVNQSAVRIVHGGQEYIYRAPELTVLSGRRVNVRVPLLSGTARVTIVDDDGNPRFLAEREPPSALLDGEGAREGQRWVREQSQQMRKLLADLEIIDLQEEMRTEVGLAAPELVPDSAGRIELAGPLAAEAAVKRKRLTPEQRKAEAKARAAEQEWVDQALSNFAQNLMEQRRKTALP